MPGAGKSTIGKKLAEKLDWGFLDLDVLIQGKTGQAPAEFIKIKGEEEFLQLEEELALGLDLAQTIFAPGGSIIYAPAAMEKLRLQTTIIYLTISLEELKQRLGKNLKERGIIGFKEKGLENLFRERNALYKRCAHFTIPGSHGAENLIYQLLF